MNDENPNIGQQFTGMIGHSLLQDSIDSVDKMSEMIKPHSDAVFSDSMASDRDILDHPATKVYSSLFGAKTFLETALEKHDEGDKVGVVHNAIQSHRHLLEALREGLHIAEFREAGSKFVDHASDITQNLTKLNKLYLGRNNER